ncbi:MAG: helix-turn-helix domain-containing protein, partial [Clostridia bacterium]|nr:helix-turn-helix domain-containing protein [Clostridia bacterium]
MVICQVEMQIILGQRLKELREENGLTQKQLAEKLQLNSVTYLHYEKSQREPPLAVLADIAVFFDVSVDYLLGLKDYD